MVTVSVVVAADEHQTLEINSTHGTHLKRFQSSSVIAKSYLTVLTLETILLEITAWVVDLTQRKGKTEDGDAYYKNEDPQNENNANVTYVVLSTQVDKAEANNTKN